MMANAPLSHNDNLDIFACSRTDSKDLINHWANDKSMRNARYQVLRDTGELLELDTSRTEYALGKGREGV